MVCAITGVTQERQPEKLIYKFLICSEKLSSLIGACVIILNRDCETLHLDKICGCRFVVVSVAFFFYANESMRRENVGAWVEFT